MVDGGDRSGGWVRIPSGFQPADPLEQVRHLGGGVNVLGYDPLWEDFARRRFQERHFRRIRQGGFRTVRVNLHAFRHMDAGNRLPEEWLRTLDWAVGSALSAGLNVVLDEHDCDACARDPQGGRDRVLAFWEQVAPRYRDAPAGVLFEILNEPGGALDDARWNALLRDALEIIRASSPRRNVVVGSARANSIKHLAPLALPAEDRHLLVTVHYYLPMEFTHQGAAWNPPTAGFSGRGWGSEEDRRAVTADFEAAQRWARENGRPMLLGEFGAYEPADLASRVAYLTHVARTAESCGWAWIHWQLEGDFRIYDREADRWIEPLHRALVPETGRGHA